MKSANLALRFLLELVFLAEFAYWGATASPHPALRILLAIGAPLLAGTIWALFGAPGASFALTPALRLALEFTLFATGCAAMIAAGQPGLGWAILALALANRLLMLIWKQ